MTALLLTALFAMSGVFALASIRNGLGRHGGAFLALRRQLRECGEWREVKITTRTVTVHSGGAVILRPEFRRPARPAAAPALPAAA